MVRCLLLCCLFCLQVDHLQRERENCGSRVAALRHDVHVMSCEGLASHILRLVRARHGVELVEVEEQGTSCIQRVRRSLADSKSPAKRTRRQHAFTPPIPLIHPLWLLASEKSFCSLHWFRSSNCWTKSFQNLSGTLESDHAAAS